MRLILGFVLLLPATMAVAGHSGLTIPKNQTFQLGGGQPNVMAVRGTNIGATIVTITARGSAGDVRIAEVQPGASFAHVFAAREAAILGNTSTSQAAKLSVDFDGDGGSLAMRYMPAKP